MLVAYGAPHFVEDSIRKRLTININLILQNFLVTKNYHEFVRKCYIHPLIYLFQQMNY